MSLRRIDLTRVADPTPLVAEAARAIGDGAAVVLPTETVYGLAAHPRQPDSIAQLRRIQGLDPADPLTHHVTGLEALDALGAVGGARCDRLIHSFWPGPLILVLPRAENHGGGTIGVRMPAHPFTIAVIAACGPSLHLSSLQPAGESPLTEAAAVESSFGDRIDLLFDAGPSPIAAPSTVVRVPSQGPLQILREGAIPTSDVHAAAARTVLFVCTGNTCRSPLAEAIARAELARALQRDPQQLLEEGIAVRSAGVSAFGSMPASDGSLQAAAEWQLDLGNHRSRPLSADLLNQAAKVYCLSTSHLAAVRSVLGADDTRAELLDPDGAVPDPIGGSLDEYRATRDRIAAAVRKRLPEIRTALGV